MPRHELSISSSPPKFLLGFWRRNWKVYSAIMASAQLISPPSLCCYSAIQDVRMSGATRTVSFARKLGTTFATGSPLLIQLPVYSRKASHNSKRVSIRSEQSTNEGTGLDVWLGRLAMAGFAAAITVEIVTGKGLLENFGLASPLPTVALAVTALVGILTAVFIFQSASKS